MGDAGEGDGAELARVVRGWILLVLVVGGSLGGLVLGLFYVDF